MALTLKQRQQKLDEGKWLESEKQRQRYVWRIRILSVLRQIGAISVCESLQQNAESE